MHAISLKHDRSQLAQRRAILEVLSMRNSIARPAVITLIAQELSCLSVLFVWNICL